MKSEVDIVQAVISLGASIPLRIIAAQIVAMNRAFESDFSFWIKEKSYPEYIGFNTKMANT